MTKPILRLLLPGLLLCGSWNGNTPDNSLLLKRKQQLETFIQSHPQEKIYLHIDKTQTTLGETIWFKVYLVDAQTHKEATVSNLIYVELIDPNKRIIETKHLNLRQNLMAGDFQIPLDSMPGNYTLRAYTNYMRNFDQDFFYQQQIRVVDPNQSAEKSETPDPVSMESDINPTKHSATTVLRFFPEGGDLITGISSKLAFTITDTEGIYMEGKVKIFDNEKRFVNSATYINQGRGFFILRPEYGKSYYAELHREGSVAQFPLPVVLQQGYILKVHYKANGNPSVIMQTNIENGLNGAFVIGQMRGQVYFTMEGKSNAMELEGQISIEGLPDGICQFTLFNPGGEPVCERLIYIENPENRIKVDLLTDKPAYTLREQVNIKLEIEDIHLSNVEANLSCAVVDLDAISVENTGDNISSYLLLASDLQDKLNLTEFFLDSNLAGRRQIQDFLMMTQGWRRFVWKKIISDDPKPGLKYLPETGFTISGITTMDRKAKPVSAQVFITAFGPDGFYMKDQVTGPDGIFIFRDFEFVDTTQILLQSNIFNAKKADKRIKLDNSSSQESIGPRGNRYVSIYLQSEGPHDINLLNRPPHSFIPIKTDYLEDRRLVSRIDSIYRDDWLIDLKEIVVKGTKKEKPQEHIFRSFYGTPSDRVILDSLPALAGNMNIFDILRGRVPGVQVFGSGIYQYAIIRGFKSLSGNNTALIFLDGISIENEEAATLNIFDIAAIDIYKGTAAALFGGRGANGVILIHTRRGSGSERYTGEATPGIYRFTHPGYYKAREFYSPDYSTTRPEHIRPDYRTTLHWQPVIEKNTHGGYSLSFFTCDKKSDYKIIIEGITEDGKPVYQEANLSVH
ncbi:MAG: TonB-dependent receptor plug domain-containing protein [Saprospiraceae bacterium]